MAAVDTRARAPRVLKHLYLGPLAAAHNLQLLQDRNIRCIINCTPLDPFHVNLPAHIETLRIPVEDEDTSEANLLMFQSMPEATSLMHGHLLMQHGVLVHCYAGRSRSATVVTAYLMMKHRCCMHLARTRVRKSRPEALRQLIFRPALGAWEDELRELYMLKQG